MFDFGTFDQFTFDEDIQATTPAIFTNNDIGDPWKKKRRHQLELLLQEELDAKEADEQILDDAVDFSEPVSVLRKIELRLDGRFERIEQLEAAIARDVMDLLEEDDEEALLLLM